MSDKVRIIVIIFLLLLLALIEINSQGKNDLNVGLLKKEGLTQIIEDRKGKPLLINLWATWCIPCREEFPDLVELRSSSDEFDLVAISVDYADELDSKVLPFLHEVDVNFPVYINGFEPDSELIEFLNKKWSGALPATFIYDKEGQQIAFLQGKRTKQDFLKGLSQINK